MMVEKPHRVGGNGNGISPTVEPVRQESSAFSEQTGEQEAELIEEVLRRENVIRAHKRVVRNGGAAGVDGVTVKELLPYCRKHWSRIRGEILSGKYVPDAVLGVEIP